jgi:hypothetical protein
MNRFLLFLAPFAFCACLDTAHDVRAVSEYRAAWESRTDSDCLRIDQLRAANPHLTAQFKKIEGR